MVRKRELQSLIGMQEERIRVLEQQREDLIGVNQSLQEEIPPLREALREAQVDAQKARSEPVDSYVVVTVSDGGKKKAYGPYADRNAAQTAKKRIQREHNEHGTGALEVSAHKVVQP